MNQTQALEIIRNLHNMPIDQVDEGARGLARQAALYLHEHKAMQKSLKLFGLESLYKALLDNYPAPAFCPFCGKCGTLVEASGEMHCEGGCWDGDAYCWDGPLPGYVCQVCGGCFLIEPTSEEVHADCNCPEDCECGHGHGYPETCEP